MPQPRPDDPNVVVMTPRRRSDLGGSDLRRDGEGGRVLLFTGVRLERFADAASFAAALAALAKPKPRRSPT